MNYDKILEEISPDKDEVTKLGFALLKVKTLIEDSAKSHNYDLEVVAGGSTAKGTFLKGNFDIDVFVRFKTLGDISTFLERILIDVSDDLTVSFEKIHGSRDYFQFTYNDFFFEIVPVKFIDKLSDMENVTDMSPLHVFWVKKHLSEKLAADIRLAKQFCKSCGVYGAESFINGVSGHVLDILIIEYGGFDNFVEAVSRWTGITVVDSESKHDDVFKELNQSKLVSPLIVVDPIDPNRNAAAALCKQKYDQLIQACSDFLKNPSKDFFEIKPFDINNLQSEQQDGELLFVVEVEPLEGKKDVVATKVLKVFEFLQRHLQLYDFSVRFSDWHYDSKICHLYFFVKDEIIPELFEREGPPVTNSVASTRFQDVHKENAYERDGRLFVKVNREFIDPTRCIQHLLKQEYVLSRTENTKLKLFVK